MTMPKPIAKYLPLDLETTGLNPERCAIIECAAFAVTSTLTLPDEGGPLVNMVIRPPAIAQWDEAALAMHRQRVPGSPALYDLCRASKLERRHLVVELVQLIEAYEWEDGKPILLGSTIHFDRGFIARHLPEIDGLLHYRHADVTPTKLAIKDALALQFPKAEARRALPDVHESLQAARTIRRLIASADPDVIDECMGVGHLLEIGAPVVDPNADTAVIEVAP